MLLVLLSAVCAVVLSGVLRSDAALWRRRVVSLLCAVQYRRGVVAAERKIRKNFEFREMARLPFPGRCWKSGGLLCCGRLLVAAGCSLRRLLVAAVARCSGCSLRRLLVAAGCLLQQICNLPLASAVGGARPPAVRTPAQPYTAGRPTPPRPQNNRSQFTCRLRARRALGGAPCSVCAVPSAFGFYCQKLVACQPDVPVPGCPGGCRICNLFRLICNLRLSRRWRTLNFRDIHLRA